MPETFSETRFSTVAGSKGSFDLARDVSAHAASASFTGERAVAPGRTEGFLELGDIVYLDGIIVHVRGENGRVGRLRPDRGELERDAVHLQEEIHGAEQEIVGLLRDGGDGAGNDQADVGSTTLERDHELQLANNARNMLNQIERALSRIENGTYGVCESCGKAIGKGRLQAFPRATLCVSCKEREERH